MAKIVKAKIRSPKIKNKKTFEELIPIEINTIDSELIVVDDIDPDVEAFVVAEEAVEEVVAVVEPVKKKNYLNNKDLLNQVLISKKQGSMTNLLAHMLQTLCRRYAKKGNFANYSYNEDMQGYAMLMLVKTWDSFKPEKSKNPFAFFTQCIKHSFIQYLKQERRQRDVKNEILIDNGLNPSHSYTLEYENDQFEKRQALFDDDSSTNNKDDFIPFVPIEYMDPTEVQEEAAEVSEVR